MRRVGRNFQPEQIGWRRWNLGQQCPGDQRRHIIAFPRPFATGNTEQIVVGAQRDTARCDHRLGTVRRMAIIDLARVEQHERLRIKPLQVVGNQAMEVLRAVS